MAVAGIFEALAQVGIETGINKARVMKLQTSTNIYPQALLESGYLFETNLGQGLRRWSHDSHGTFL